MTAKPVLTISVCEEPGHDGHGARITVGDDMQTSTFCLRTEHAVFLGETLAGVSPALTAARGALRSIVAATPLGREATPGECEFIRAAARNGLNGAPAADPDDDDGILADAAGMDDLEPLPARGGVCP